MIESSLQSPTRYPYSNYPCLREEQKMKVLTNHFDGTTDALLTAGKIGRVVIGVPLAASVSLGFMGFMTDSPLSADPVTVLATITIALSILAVTQYLIPDYESSKEVAGYRHLCESLSLSQAIKKYGKYVWERKLLNQRQVTFKYFEEGSRLRNIPEILNYYSEVQRLLGPGSFTIPCPKESFRESLQQKYFHSNLGNCIYENGLDNIFSWELFPPEIFVQKWTSYLQDKSLPSIRNLYLDAEEIRKVSDFKNTYRLPPIEEVEKKLRIQCKKKSLREIIDLHSAPLLFSGKLLSLDEFKTKWKEHARILFAEEGISAVIKSYKELVAAQRENPSYLPEHPSSFREAWLKKMKNSFPGEVLESHNISELIEYGIIPNSSYPETAKKLQIEFIDLKTDYEKQKIELALRKNEEVKILAARFENALSSLTVKHEKALRG